MLSVCLRIPRWIAHPSIDISIRLSVLPPVHPSSSGIPRCGIINIATTTTVASRERKVSLCTTSCLDIPPYIRHRQLYAQIASPAKRTSIFAVCIRRSGDQLAATSLRFGANKSQTFHGLCFSTGGGTRMRRNGRLFRATNVARRRRRRNAPSFAVGCWRSLPPALRRRYSDGRFGAAEETWWNAL